MEAIYHKGKRNGLASVSFLFLLVGKFYKPSEYVICFYHEL
ncbi:hypothetical protein C810_03329 [Lachnospiraceae bacterium A2]|nr:hypothetical protein C810_03329 [Lachnospiraceae bacterium A2]